MTVILPFIQEIPLIFPATKETDDSLKSLRGRMQVKELYKLHRFNVNAQLEEDITDL